MNSETGQVYWTAKEVQEAEERGEPLIPLTPIIPETNKPWPQSEGRPPNRHERRKQAKLGRKRLKR